MHVYYRISVDFKDESKTLMKEQLNNNSIDEDNDLEIVWSWSSSIFIDEHKEVHFMHHPYKNKYDVFFNDIIRDAVKGYKHKMRFDHFKWIIEKWDKQSVEFICSYWDESMNFEVFVDNLKKELSYSPVRILELKTQEIDHKDYFQSHTKSMENGSLECSTAWLDAAGRYDYIHELYEDND